jgi:integrase
MRYRTSRIPSLRHHKASGQGVVTLNGRDFYLGRFGSKAAEAEYRRLIDRWEAGGRRPLHRDKSDLTVAELLADYLKESDTYYRINGRESSQLRLIRRVVADFNRLFGREPVASFGPVEVKALRQCWVDRGLARNTCNQQAGIVKRIVAWGVEHRLAPAEVYFGLQAVRQLKRGRTVAPDYPKVEAVADQHIAAILPLVNPVVAALIQVQNLSGMRPGEALRLRASDIDRTGPVWLYKPTDPATGLHSHKTAHRDRDRIIALGPRCQAILAPFIAAQPDPHGYLFRAPAAANRGAKRNGRNRFGGNPSGRHYSLTSYGQAIHRACDKAKVDRFSPNRLRHSAGTRFRRHFDLDSARTALGHSAQKMTEVYADIDISKAIEIASKIG